MSTRTNPMDPHGDVPKYVPPHLRGKVWDFRNEPDGRISFQHPEASVGVTPEQSRVFMTPEEYQMNFDRAHRWANLDQVAREGYAPMQRRQKTPSRLMNEAIADKLRGALDWGTSSQGKAVGTAGLLSALAGGMGGYLWGRHAGGSKIRRALLMALLVGGAGAGATALAQRGHNRREAWLSKQASDAVSRMIIRAVNGDPTLGAAERALIFRALARADRGDREDLGRELRRVGVGAGVGALVMRFLGAKGLLPITAGAILGGVVGRRRGDGLERNRQGQVSITNYF